MDSEVNPKLSDAEKKSKSKKLVDDERKKLFQDRKSNTCEGPFIPGPDDLKPAFNAASNNNRLGTGVRGAGGGTGSWGRRPFAISSKWRLKA